MTTDPNGWFLTSQALDQKDTATALATALPEGLEDGFFYRDAEKVYKSIADNMAVELARAGYALVRITPEHGAPTEVPFLSRKED